jgi:hypothetical protein
MWLIIPLLDLKCVNLRDEACPDEAQVASLRQFVTMFEGWADCNFYRSFLFSTSIFLF